MCLPLKTDGAAGETDQDHSLAGAVEGFQLLPLNGRQLYVGAVSALEAGELHLHLLAFESGGEAACKYHCINPFELLQQIRRNNLPGNVRAALDVSKGWNPLQQSVF